MVSKLNSVGSSTYQRLKNDIIFGVLEPGRKLKLNALRDQYEASLSTLRETLNRLSSEGFCGGGRAARILRDADFKDRPQ